MSASQDILTNPDNHSQNSFANQNSHQHHQSTMRQTVYQPISTVSITRVNSQRNANSHHHSLVLTKHHDKSLPTQRSNTPPPLSPLPTDSPAPSNAPANSFNNFSSSAGSFELVIQLRDVENKEQEFNENFWDAADTHHMLPIFSSARAYVPSSFESLLIQSFFCVLTPLICEKLVCGQGAQTVLQYEIPHKMVGRKFLDLFRLLSHHHVSRHSYFYFLQFI